jgi:hypothetical protein
MAVTASEVALREKYYRTDPAGPINKGGLKEPFNWNISYIVHIKFL